VAADGLDWVIGLDLFSFTFKKFAVTNYKRDKKILPIKNISFAITKFQAAQVNITN